MAGLLPVIAAFERAFRIYQDVGDVLDVADFVGAAANLEQRVVASRAGIGRIEEQAVRETLAPACGQLPVLALDIVDDRRDRPAEPRRPDTAEALAAPGRAEGREVAGARVTEMARTATAEEKPR